MTEAAAREKLNRESSNYQPLVCFEGSETWFPVELWSSGANRSGMILGTIALVVAGVSLIVSLMLLSRNTDLDPESVAGQELGQRIEERLQAETWQASGDNKNMVLKFYKDGSVIDQEDNRIIWVWRRRGSTLWCNWRTSGWVKFVVDDPEATEWIGRSARGDRWILQAVDES